MSSRTWSLGTMKSERKTSNLDDDYEILNVNHIYSVGGTGGVRVNPLIRKSQAMQEGNR